MRSYNIESDGQLFKMQQEAIQRAREAHRKAMQAEAARKSANNTEHREEEVKLQEEKRAEEEKRTARSSSHRQRQAKHETERSRKQRQNSSQGEGIRPTEKIGAENIHERRESLLSSLLGSSFDTKGILKRLSEPRKLFGDLPFLSKNSGLGKILGNLRVDDLILLGLLILLIHEDADIELLVILGFLFIVGL